MKRGVYPASVTPLNAKGDIDFPSVARLMAWFKAAGCSGIVVAGTNGEGPSLSAVEKRDLVKGAVELADGLEVVLGVSTPSLDEAHWLCKQSFSAGAHAVLLMAPGFFRDVSERAILDWYQAVLDRSPIPILVYNFPKRTGITIPAETMRALAQHERMLGLKDSSGDAGNIVPFAQALSGTGKCLFVGDETLLGETLRHGWTGTISGAANVLPSWLCRVVAEWDIDVESATNKLALIEPALRAVRSCPQPASNKAILFELGILPSDDVRLPLEKPSPDRIAEALRRVRELEK